ncbi:MAG: YigZ family protein [Piscirickettsiaceae bacterium CG_4_9_14_3_um_filter_43_564]|nr:YigZ family protein [Thiomicrospira sp.]OIP96531.1 MAG: YigZ family protein [Thiomicrospira sp. CG2_30_44_34]PIQ02912.1 MAG: YigZ family protein [Piscirickettsiaceae bacterium CG18_big_fil_WC_8_21_14_2_50_44_103]PIU38942.1 MAG: YigZ family protein [Piscirickettsiaceae bacterium CG07_land_8_20_14_0_80_44_28]PIW57463.1 MAG: YigZ family protein [Piscirickettsiaceae bacterium CG12_big_fil_rev_8_21_14_0_65_44_934]PIW78314.1 MAG: YigZ family protein [Piscirickettsiaceae bacterium CG_4_8_14_3_um_f
MGYQSAIAPAQAEIVIKKSRFIALAQPIQSRAEGMNWLQQVQQQYPDARHHCWAYLLGNPHCASSAGMGDDGEPSGTAGKPILNVLQHKSVGDVMIIVVRYFGGIKLGAGGLTRAYSQAAQAVMEVLPIAENVPMVALKIHCGFSQEQQIRHLLAQYDGQLQQVDYQQQVQLSVVLPKACESLFCEQLQPMQCGVKQQSELAD